MELKYKAKDHRVHIHCSDTNSSIHVGSECHTSESHLSLLPMIISLLYHHFRLTHIQDVAWFNKW